MAHNGSRGIRPLIYERFCNHCGKAFMAATHVAESCSVNCWNKAWRARTMLAGTHGYVNGQWGRFPSGYKPRKKPASAYAGW